MSAAPIRAKGPPARPVPRLACCAVLLLLTAPATAADPFPGEGVPSDLKLTVAARRALLDEDRLAGVPLGVSVRHGTAILWGTAPSGELIRLALDRLRRLPGVAGVRSEVLLETVAWPAADSPAAAPEGPSAVCTSPAPGPRAPGELAGQVGPRGRAPGLPLAGSAAPPGPGVALGPPVAGGLPAAEPRRPIPRSADLGAAVERVRRGDRRFIAFQAEVRERTVILHGSAGEDLMDFAEAVRRLPGVERVLVEQGPGGRRP
jgi:hypothetical protein